MNISKILQKFEEYNLELIAQNRPSYCPNCGDLLSSTVELSKYEENLDEGRHLVSVYYDCYCEKCGKSFVISPDDVHMIEFIE